MLHRLNDSKADTTLFHILLWRVALRLLNRRRYAGYKLHCRVNYQIANEFCEWRVLVLCGVYLTQEEQFIPEYIHRALD